MIRLPFPWAVLAAISISSALAQQASEPAVADAGSRAASGRDSFLSGLSPSETAGRAAADEADLATQEQRSDAWRARLVQAAPQADATLAVSAPGVESAPSKLSLAIRGQHEAGMVAAARLRGAVSAQKAREILRQQELVGERVEAAESLPKIAAGVPKATAELAQTLRTFEQIQADQNAFFAQYRALQDESKDLAPEKLADVFARWTAANQISLQALSQEGAALFQTINRPNLDSASRHED